MVEDFGDGSRKGMLHVKRKERPRVSHVGSRSKREV